MSAPSHTPATPPIAMRGVKVSALRDTESVVVEHVDWTVIADEFWVIGGLQGSGKSDFLMTAAGLLGPRAGEYHLFGEPMPIFEDSRLAQRLRLGLVFDGGQLLNHLTVFENLALPLRYHRNLDRSEVEAEVRTMLSAMDLLPWAANTPGAMSHPWRKRAGLARALMLQPDVLLVDSPLSGADSRHANWWLEFLTGLGRGHTLMDGRPTTVVVTAEDFRPWRAAGTRFAVLANQRFVVLGDWNQVERNPDAATRALLGEPKPH